MADLGFLGMGVMGSRMATRLLAAGHQVTVWNRTAEKALPLRDQGAAVASSPAEAARGRDAVFANLTDGAALMSVVMGPRGVLEAEPLPAVILDMATVAPVESEAIATELEARGVQFLRCPVSGTAEWAATGDLTILVSGRRDVFDAMESLLAVLGKESYYVGEGESSRYLKLIHQMMIGATMQVWAEGLVMGEKAGLDWGTMLEVLGNSAVGSGVVKGKIPTLRSRVFDPPAMSLHNIVKDIDLALAAGASVGVELPATKHIRTLYDRSLAAGLESKDYSAIIIEMEKRAGLEPREATS